MAQDWRDSLRSLLGESESNLRVEESSVEIVKPRQTERLDIIIDRKGRAGKVATIISGFTIGDDEIAEIATKLKRSLGVGGSARGGEILIQGDRAKQVHELLTKMDLKSRII